MKFYSTRDRSNLADLKLAVTKSLTSDGGLYLPEHIDNLVFCPGSILLKPFHRISEAEFQSDFNQNVFKRKYLQYYQTKIWNNTEQSNYLNNKNND